MNYYKIAIVAGLSCFLVACSTKPITTAPEKTEPTAPSSILNPTDGIDNTVKGNSALGSLLTLAELQENKGNLQGATRLLERAIRISPRNPEIYLRLAELSYRQGKNGQAQSFAEKALSLNPNQSLTQQAELLLEKISLQSLY
ncbi:tetratricopeptide repeat protein [Psychromonas algicola]|uniref:tetratricopeptide repeat protein n=1 Tax=Psychromonas algicola TaxID=2555642 RepID=UPI001068BAC2|nr:tetratricopeptide repeat protein [Psychromonas sp. RZ5]TEW48295.1 tetratricopeptide repeat protein [Psychromonas sp. RZ5]